MVSIPIIIIYIYNVTIINRIDLLCDSLLYMYYYYYNFEYALKVIVFSNPFQKQKRVHFIRTSIGLMKTINTYEEVICFLLVIVIRRYAFFTK